MFNKKIVIVTPEITFPAGVANHYLGLEKYFSDDVVYFQYKTGECLQRAYPWCPVMARYVLRVLYKIADLFRFLLIMWKYESPTVLLNPSLGKSALRRDRYFLRLSKLFSCRVGVFIHGWDKNYFHSLCSQKTKFTDIWNQADCFFVLAREFVEGLQKLGIAVPVHLTTTKVSDELVNDVSRKPFTSVRNILFLARVTQEKGIYTTIDAYKIVKEQYNDVTLTIVGMGPELDRARAYVLSKSIQDVSFTGALSGVDLRAAFVASDLYILPTHGEGMPTSVLEAMAFGLPVVTRPVGGLVDFFEDQRMGYLVNSTEPDDFAEKILGLIKYPEKADTIGQYNWHYSRQRFLASKVAGELEQQLKEM